MGDFLIGLMTENYVEEGRNCWVMGFHARRGTKKLPIPTSVHRHLLRARRVGGPQYDGLCCSIAPFRSGEMQHFKAGQTHFRFPHCISDSILNLFSLPFLALGLR